MARDYPPIRFAAPHEGPVIQALFRANRLVITDWFDWTRPLAENWLLAGGADPWACLMLHYGTPIGRVDYLVFQPNLSHRQRALATTALSYTAFNLLAQHGSQVVGAMIGSDHPGWQHVITRRGGVPTFTGTYYLKRL